MQILEFKVECCGADSYKDYPDRFGISPPEGCTNRRYAGSNKDLFLLVLLLFYCCCCYFTFLLLLFALLLLLLVLLLVLLSYLFYWFCCCCFFVVVGLIVFVVIVVLWKMKTCKTKTKVSVVVSKMQENKKESILKIGNENNI